MILRYFDSLSFGTASGIYFASWMISHDLPIAYGRCGHGQCPLKPEGILQIEVGDGRSQRFVNAS